MLHAAPHDVPYNTYSIILYIQHPRDFTAFGYRVL